MLYRLQRLGTRLFGNVPCALSGPGCTLSRRVLKFSGRVCSSGSAYDSEVKVGQSKRFTMSEKSTSTSAEASASNNSSDDSERESNSAPEIMVEEEMIMALELLQNRCDVDTFVRLLSSGNFSQEITQRVMMEFAGKVSVPRPRLRQYSTMDDAVNLIRNSRRIVMLTGAGISVSCGIPYFRGENGIYTILRERFPELDDPQAIFEKNFFVSNPKPFFSFAKKMYPEFFKPSLTHYFIKSLETTGRLLRNYTQNVDSLEHSAGIERVVYCHGSFATASCMVCGHKVPIEHIKKEIVEETVPHCVHCGPLVENAIMKPDIVFFNEMLPESFADHLRHDQERVDLLIVVGSSLKVGPVNGIPKSIAHRVPQILVNRERLKRYTFDIELLGDCDVIFNELALRLGESFSAICTSTDRLKKMCDLQPDNDSDKSTASTSSQTDTVKGKGENAKKRKSRPPPSVPEGYYVHRRPNRYFFSGAQGNDCQ